jgi:uncharacterized Zn finger protein
VANQADERSMMVGNLPRFEIAALKRVAGAAFARGEAYHRDRRVELLAVGPRRVLAEESGAEDYRVRLVCEGETFGGECTRPAFEDFGFCKHMIATALAANQSAVESAPDEGAFARIRPHRRAKPGDALVSMILEAGRLASCYGDFRSLWRRRGASWRHKALVLPFRRAA